MSLCEVCTSTLQGSEIKSDDYDTFTHHLSILTYLDAVKINCYICWRSYQELDSASQSFLRKLETQLKKLGHDGIISNDPKQDDGDNWPSSFSFLDVFMVEPYKIETRRTIKIHVIYRPDYATVVAQELRSCSDNDNRSLEIAFTEEAAAFHSSLFPTRFGGHTIFEINLLEYKADDTRVRYHIPKSSQTGSVETLALTRTWIRDCELHHKLCRGSRTVESWYPTRLLDLGQTVASDEAVVCRIVSGSAVLPRESYATVSHRWGTSNFLKLTTENLATLKHGIQHAELPKTFADCIDVARQLQIRYLWIDSLCIIQSGDAGKDWLEEASTMHLVYSNAVCNILSNWGEASEGLFSQRDLRIFDQLQINLNIISKGTSHRANFVSVEESLWKDEVSLSPLNRRGWVLQERILSRRNLHFCRREVFFECRHSICCESVPIFYQLEKLCRQNDTHIKKTLMQPEDAIEVMQLPESFELPDDARSNFAYSSWSQIVETYSRCQLTFDSDKLVALAGLAMHIKPMINDTYVAGLWLRRLPTQLLWERSYETNQEPLPKTTAGYRAPSFSWASIDLPVTLSTLDDLDIIANVSCIMFRRPESAKESEREDQQVTGDLFGTISRPLVEVKVIGRVVPAKFVPPPAEHGPLSQRISICPLGYESERPVFHELVFTNLDIKPNRSQWEYLANMTVYYVPLIYDGRHFESLLLEAVESSMGRFRRIGVLNSFKITAGDIYMSNWGHEHEVESWMYNSETGFHTIYIV